MPGIDVHDGLDSVFRIGRNTHKQPESVYMLVNHMEEYDAIADAYRDSKRLPFREYIERYTLFEMLGDVRGKKVLDMACGESEPEGSAQAAPAGREGLSTQNMWA